MRIELAEDLYQVKVQELLAAEQQTAEALPGIIESVTSEELRSVLERHAKETELQVERLRTVGQRLSGAAAGRKSRVMEGLLEEARLLEQEDTAPELLDLGVAGICQKIEQLEIIAYTQLIELGRLLGFPEEAASLEKSLQEEMKMAQLLVVQAETLLEKAVELEEVVD